MILHLPGEAALSNFRVKKHLLALQAILPVTQLQVFYEYFIELKSPLENSELERLDKLLNSKTLFARKFTHSATLFLVVPRVGTLSPWSSKATDIAKLCDFSSIKRIERGVSYYVELESSINEAERTQIASLLHDPMLETVLYSFENSEKLLKLGEPLPLCEIEIQKHGKNALDEANIKLGLALSADEIDYFYNTYHEIKRNPTDVELMMFAQANSEHCRHKIFNADWIIDGIEQEHSLFSMIRNTHQKSPQGVISAYEDNAAIFAGPMGKRFFPGEEKRYQYQKEFIHALAKVETHNHPTAIAPFPGAATGAGGEIRDEGATGRGAKPKAGLTGFSVSHLRIPDFIQPWESPLKKPAHIASSLDIMIAGPIGGAAYNNEFGRPNICGYFRTFEYSTPNVELEGYLRGAHEPVLSSGQAYIRGYHKPIMLAGGIGNVRPMHTHKNQIAPDDLIIVLGGPALLIGLGGGAASSILTQSDRVDLDFASVQRANPEMERRCQEVIDACWALGDKNPIVSIHDVGAGGLSNAIPEIVHDSHRGAKIQLRDIPSNDPHLSPLEIWCNEAQERYVLVIKPNDLGLFKKMIERERCPYAVVGFATTEERLVVEDSYFKNRPIDLSMSVLFGKPPKLSIKAHTHTKFFTPDIATEEFLSTLNLNEKKNISLRERFKNIVHSVLHFPAVASKQFLITIGDRTVGGMVARDQMIGPWQVPVADVAVTATDFEGYTGEAMAIGERTPLGVMHPAACARMALGEAMTNLVAADIHSLSDIKLSANWMAAANFSGEAIALFEAVKTVGLEICPALEICIPVGKDSLSMQMQWKDNGTTQQVVAPLSPIITAFAQVADIRMTLTPELANDQETALWLIDLGRGRDRIGGSVLMQVHSYLGDTSPDLEDPILLRNFFEAIRALRQANLLLAYHDRSDGGLWTTLCEMSFASHCGLNIEVPVEKDAIAFLFNEELGGVLQVRIDQQAQFFAILREHQLESLAVSVARINHADQISVSQNDINIYQESRVALQKIWSETSFRLQLLRDNPDCAREEFETLSAVENQGLSVSLTFNPNENIAAPLIQKGHKPPIAILREQGVNGQLEMASAFTRAGFDCFDVHMSDLLARRETLDKFVGFVAVGGFSYGDVLGAGRGWASTILHNTHLFDEFSRFFQQQNTFALGVCNGCQMMARLKSLIPGADHWPIFTYNRSEQFEARFSNVEIAHSSSALFHGLAGSRLPVVSSHGEGRADWSNSVDFAAMKQNDTISLRYIDHLGNPAETYPANPNGSPEGVAGITTLDGRFNLLMPHPERVFRTVQWSWHPTGWGEDSPWMRIFQNLRVWVG